MANKNNILTELKIVEGARALLAMWGETSAPYLTAEFSPYTNQQRPDLIFIPAGSEDLVFFVEFKFAPKQGIDKIFINNLLEHKLFVEENFEDKFVKFAFATNVELAQKDIDFLSSHEIKSFHSVTNEADLYESILEWSKS